MSQASWCPQCGPETRIDEDGCCSTCGCDAVGDGADQAVAALARADAAEARAEAAEAEFHRMSRVIETYKQSDRMVESEMNGMEKERDEAVAEVARLTGANETLERIAMRADATAEELRAEVERLREQDRGSRELLAHHDEAYERVMVRAEAAEAEAEELTAEVEQLRANAASAQSCPSCGGLLPDHAPECGRYPLVVEELRAEAARLRAELAWFADASNYHPGDMPSNREADLIHEHTARARKAREG